MQTYFISIQSTYAGAKLALFQGKTCLETITKKDSRASSHLIPYVDGLLENNNLSLSDMSFIAVDKGPGAFTSLRVTIATVNGMAFTKQVPLIGVDGLDALSREADNSSADVVISLLNAYNNDVYYLINTHHQTLDKGCKKIEELLTQITDDYANKKLIFTGNGTLLHKELITKTLRNKALIPEPIQETASAQTIGLMAFDIFKKQVQTIYKIEPNYMKTQTFATRKPLFKKSKL